MPPIVALVECYSTVRSKHYQLHTTCSPTLWVEKLVTEKVSDLVAKIFAAVSLELGASAS